jgi:RNA polymerase sigma factor (sigma-70 family)
MSFSPNILGVDLKSKEFCTECEGALAFLISEQESLPAASGNNREARLDFDGGTDKFTPLEKTASRERSSLTGFTKQYGISEHGAAVIDWDEIGRLIYEVYEFISTIEDFFFNRIKQAFAKEYRQRGELVVCREATYILARTISKALDLPIGGNSPDRLELTSGAVLKGNSQDKALHRWIAVYQDNQRALLIDPTYGQFDSRYKNKILIGEYGRIANDFHFIEWEELKDMEKERLDLKGYSDEQAKEILDARWRRTVELFGDPYVPQPLLAALIEFSPLVENVRTGLDIDPDIKENITQIERVISEIYQGANELTYRKTLEIPREDLHIEVVLGRYIEFDNLDFHQAKSRSYPALSQRTIRKPTVVLIRKPGEAHFEVERQARDSGISLREERQLPERINELFADILRNIPEEKMIKVILTGRKGSHIFTFKEEGDTLIFNIHWLLIVEGILPEVFNSDLYRHEIAELKGFREGLMPQEAHRLACGVSYEYFIGHREELIPFFNAIKELRLELDKDYQDKLYSILIEGSISMLASEINEAQKRKALPSGQEKIGHLMPQEKELLRLWVGGFSREEIMRRLEIKSSYYSVLSSRIFSKLGIQGTKGHPRASDYLRAIKKAVELKWIQELDTTLLEEMAKNILTKREQEIAVMLAQDMPFALIRKVAGITRGKVHTHIKSIYSKLEVDVHSVDARLKIAQWLLSEAKVEIDSPYVLSKDYSHPTFGRGKILKVIRQEAGSEVKISGLIVAFGERLEYVSFSRDEHSYIIVQDTQSQAILGLYDKRLTARKIDELLELYSRIKIAGDRLGRWGNLKSAGSFRAAFGLRRKGERIDYILAKGLKSGGVITQAWVYNKDGEVMHWDFALIYNQQTGILEDSCLNITKARLLSSELNDREIETRTTKDGAVRLAGQYLFGIDEEPYRDALIRIEVKDRRMVAVRYLQITDREGKPLRFELGEGKTSIKVQRNQKEPLREKDKAILEFFGRYYLAEGRFPLYREVSEGLNIDYRHLQVIMQKLQLQGYLISDKGRWEMTPAGLEAAGVKEPYYTYNKYKITGLWSQQLLRELLEMGAEERSILRILFEAQMKYRPALRQKEISQDIDWFKLEKLVKADYLGRIHIEEMNVVYVLTQKGLAAALILTLPEELITERSFLAGYGGYIKILRIYDSNVPNRFPKEAYILAVNEKGIVLRQVNLGLPAIFDFVSAENPDIREKAVVITAEVEKELLVFIIEAQNNPDDKLKEELSRLATDTLVSSYLGLIRKLASQRIASGHPLFEDFIQEGILALCFVIKDYMKTHSAFDVIRFRDYAQKAIADWLDDFRKEKNRHYYGAISLQKKFSDDPDSQTLEERLSTKEEDGPEAEAIKNAENEKLQSLLSCLKPLQKQIVKMVIIEEISLSEAASLLGLELKSVERLLNSALKELRRRIKSPLRLHSYPAIIKARAAGTKKTSFRKATAVICADTITLEYKGEPTLTSQEEDFFLKALKEAYLGLANVSLSTEIPLLFSCSLTKAAEVNNGRLEINQLLLNTENLTKEELTALRLALSKEILSHELKHIFNPELSEEQIRQQSLEYLARNPQVLEALIYIDSHMINGIRLDKQWREKLWQRESSGNVSDSVTDEKLQHQQRLKVDYDASISIDEQGGVFVEYGGRRLMVGRQDIWNEHKKMVKRARPAYEKQVLGRL